MIGDAALPPSSPTFCVHDGPRVNQGIATSRLLWRLPMAWYWTKEERKSEARELFAASLKPDISRHPTATPLPGNSRSQPDREQVASLQVRFATFRQKDWMDVVALEIVPTPHYRGTHALLHLCDVLSTPEIS
jgi:hypothetical protein